MRYPVLIKPGGAHGGGLESHTIAVVSSEAGLGELARLDRDGGTPLDLGAPFVVQEYIAHPGVMYKIYVVGDDAVFACRPSLGEGDLGAGEGGVARHVRFFQGVSRRPGAGRGDGPDGGSDGGSTPEAGSPPAAGGAGMLSRLSRDAWTTPELLGLAETPPDWFCRGLGRELARRLGLRLFNIDVILPGGGAPGGERTAFVVDINYFPGYDKLPGWQGLLLGFLKKSAEEGRRRRAGGAGGPG